MKVSHIVAVLGVVASLNVNATVITAGNVSETPAGIFELSTQSSMTDGDIESFLGLSSTIDSISSGDAIEGSAISEVFAVSVGDIFSFGWTWFTDEDPAAPENTRPLDVNDFSFYNLSLDGVDLSTAVIADTFTVNNAMGTVSWVATASGELGFGAGVMNVGLSRYDSRLLVHDINVERVSVPVSESGSLALLGLGLAGLGFSRKLRK